MEVVPYVARLEVEQIIDVGAENKLYMQTGQNILKNTRIHSCFSCPLIPLCRLIPYARVRGLRDDVTSAFAREGYMQEKGVFIVSIWTCYREETNVIAIKNYIGML
ncbi:hypothetical protein GOP47_0018370 [Adiantum capillus-veneris]|uniref:Uncharacterized protein n=1 Tax=Adiantum capillus-veneris TaxID=13818 RepID=A0A9D4UHM1_ADICA|nr:hypothetical protein GOP47_0018370 [Adiantum capillus-veneris]